MKPGHIILIVLLTLACAGPSLAQQRWEKTYGGTDADWVYSVQQTRDGGYIVAGETNSFGNGLQFYLIKADASGDTLWTRTYGGNSTDQGYFVQQTQDGGYIVAGVTSSFGNLDQVYLIKTDASGDTLWTRTYGGTDYDRSMSVQQTQDRGYIVAGTTSSFGSAIQVYLVKTNVTGDTLWTRTYGGPIWNYGYFVQQTSDGGYIVTGVTIPYGNTREAYLIKTNSSGDTVWTRTYGGSEDDWGYSVQETQDGGYVVVGRTNSFGDSLQVYLVKTNAGGDTLWTRTYGGTGDEYGRSVQQTQDGGYIVAGMTNSFGNGHEDAYLIKTNASGDTLWTRTYGGTGSEYGWSVQQTQDGGYIVAGYTTSFGNGWQVYLVKTDANGNVGVKDNKGFEGPRVQGFKITPNPFISFAVVPGGEKETFELYDVSGRKVGSYKGDRIGANLPAGVYFLRTSGKTSTPVRIVKVR